MIILFTITFLFTSPAFAQTENENVYGFTYKNYIEPILLIIIPTVLVVILAPNLTKNWQFRSAKIQMKKEVLEDFSKSGINQIITLHQFVGRFLITYGNYDISKYDPENGISTFQFTIPTEEDKLPKNLLKDEFTTLQKQYDESKLNHEPKFISLLNLYYRDESLIEDYLEIQKLIGKLKNVVYTMIDVTSVDEFSTLSKYYDEIFPKFRDLTTKLRKRLITQEIIIPDKESNITIIIPKNQISSEKRFALLQLLGTLVSSVGAIIVAMGLSILSLSMNYTLIPLGDSNVDVEQLYTLKDSVAGKGWSLILFGSSILIVGLGAIFAKIMKLKFTSS